MADYHQSRDDPSSSACDGEAEVPQLAPEGRV